MALSSATKVARAYVLKTAKDLPPDVERYVQEGKDSGMDEGQAWAIAWSRYCKYKNPGSDHCKKDPSDYFKGREASNKTAGKVVYVGAMVEKPQNLLSWWKSKVGPLLPKHIAHHMTIKFAPTEAELALLPIGKEVYFEVIGYVDDGHVQAVVVQPHGVKSKNPVPHVTIATDGKTPPVKANDLLKDGFTPLGGPKVPARVGVFIDGQDVFELPNPKTARLQKSTRQ